MSNELPVLKTLRENSTDVPVSVGQVDNYVRVLVVLSVFAGGSLVLVSLLLLFCHRCCMVGRNYSRASDDPEKTNTTYVEDSQPAQDVLSASSCHDGDSDRFISTATTGRRVSFNESALYEQEKAAQDKGRRYTLTEGDFHHLKKARLTHLHLPPAPCDLKILTIMECDSNESSTVNINEAPASKVPLSIYQLSGRRVYADPMDWVGGLPGDPHHSVIMDQGTRSSLVKRPPHRRSQTMENFGNNGVPESKPVQECASFQTLGQTSVLNFFSKLRRHASLEGAGPYLKRWKFESNQRAASLDDKGSPKRWPFQRQRAASETTDHMEEDSSLRDDTIESFPQSPSSGLQSLSAECLTHPTPAPTPSVFFSRLELEAMMEIGVSDNTSTERLCLLPHDPCGQEQAPEKDEESKPLQRAVHTEPAGARQDFVQENDRFESHHAEKDKESFAHTTDSQENVNSNDQEMVDGDGLVLGVMTQHADSDSLQLFIRQESTEAPPSLYRDIWSLRASLEQYASSDQSSTDRESIRSDADSVSSFGGAGARSGLDTCLSQDLDDELDGEVEVEDGRSRGNMGNSNTGNGAVGDAETGNRKLLQMDSGYASIEAPSRAPEDMRLFGTSGASRGKTASERRFFFTNSGRKGSVCESVEAQLLQEELEENLTDSNETLHNSSSQSAALQDSDTKSIQPQVLESLCHPVSTTMKPQASSPVRPRLRRRDYSIDEKTDALFNEFLRHDPRFDQQDSPLRSRRRSRVHLRKQWQRHKQYSDPGSSAGGRYSPSLERQRFTPLRRGDSAGYPLDTKYHSTLSRIASAADEEANECGANEEATKQSSENNEPVEEGTSEAETSLEDEEVTRCKGGAGCESQDKDTESTHNLLFAGDQASHTAPAVNNKNNNSSQVNHSEGSLTDKLVTSVEERLYGDLRSGENLSPGRTEGAVAIVLTASPDFKPI